MLNASASTLLVLSGPDRPGNAPQWRDHPLSPERRANRGAPDTYVSSIHVNDGGAAVAAVCRRATTSRRRTRSMS